MQKKKKICAVTDQTCQNGLHNSAGDFSLGDAPW